MCFAQNNLEKAQVLMQQKAYHKAETLLAKYVAENTENLVALELLGDSYAYQKKWDEAILQYQKLTVKQPENANSFYKYGGALSQKAIAVNKLRAISYLSDIETAFLQALKRNPKHIESHWALARYYMHVPGIFGGSKTKAMQHVETLLEISPVDGYLAKGHYYEDEKEFVKSEIYYKKAIAIGGSKVCYQHLVDLYKLQKEYQKAIQVLDEAYLKLQLEDFLTQRKKLERKY